jgi:hypothetical protein
VGIIRGIASVPGHVIFSCIWGCALGNAKFRPEQERAGLILSGLAGAMLLHGIFNFSLGVFEALGLLLILVVVIPLGWWMTCRNIRCAHAHEASACAAQNAPPVPGPAVSSPGPAPEGNPHPPGTAGAAAGPAGVQDTRAFCTRCGAANLHGTRFCENCGQEF